MPKKTGGALTQKHKVLVTKKRAHFLVTQTVFPTKAGPISGPENTVTGVSRKHKKTGTCDGKSPQIINGVGAQIYAIVPDTLFDIRS